MTQRVTDYHFQTPFMTSLHTSNSKLADLQRQISSGQRIGLPDDDPFGTAQVLDFDAQVAETQQYRRNISDASGMLATEDGALNNVGTTLQRIRDLVVQASNTTNDQNALNSIAAEVRQLKESIRDQANARFGGMFVFSGTSDTTQPYPSPANAYVGTNNVMARRVASGLQVNVNMAGPTVFGTTVGAAPTQMSMLDLCDRIVSDLTSGIPADREELRSTVIDAIDLNHSNVLQQRANIGATQKRLDAIDEQLSSMEERLSDARSKIGDTDIAKAYSDLQTQNTMYQAALAAGAKIMKNTLLDFL